MDVEMSRSAAGADGPTAGTAVHAEEHGVMPHSELRPTADHHQRHPAEAAQPASPGQAGAGELMQFQLKQLIRGILAQQDLDPGIRMALLGHLSQNPGHPEQALLAHLREVQDPKDLPPFKARREPTMQASGS
jgi:hypothetical protein